MLGLVAHTCSPEDWCEFETSLGPILKPCPKQQQPSKNFHIHTEDRQRKSEWAGDVAQLVECLPTIHKALGSIPSMP